MRESRRSVVVGGDGKIAVLVSGGKDSTATLLLALGEHGKENVVPVFADTGFEASDTYEYLDYLERELGIEVVRLRNPEGYDLPSLILKKKRFPNSRMRFCTALLKQAPVALYLMERKDIRELWMGVRAGESKQRAEKYGNLTPEDTWNYAEWLSNNGYLRKRHLKELTHIQCRFPIVNWTEDEVFNYLGERGIEPNPLYIKGHRRVGCFPCVLGSWADFRACRQTEEGKKNILKLREIEKHLNAQGYNTRLKDHITAKELVRKLELGDAQGNLFCEEVCELCRT